MRDVVSHAMSNDRTTHRPEFVEAGVGKLQELRCPLRVGGHDPKPTGRDESLARGRSLGGELDEAHRSSSPMIGTIG